MRVWAARSAYVIAASIFLTTVCYADPVIKPPVPIGVDPGGVLVALIGGGIDYTQPEIAKVLARDGEGEIIGWDFVDEDRRPYQAYAAGLHEQFAIHALTRTGKDRFAVFRTKPGDQASVANAIGFAAKALAPISFVSAHLQGDGSISPDFQLLASAAQKFPDMLFVVPAGDKTTMLGEAFQFDNVLVVAARVPLIGNDAEKPGTTVGRIAIDIAAAGDHSWEVRGADFVADGRINCTEVAAARVAALAAHILAAEPKLTGADLKKRIVALAKPFPNGAANVARYGWIEDPAGAVVETK